MLKFVFAVFACYRLAQFIRFDDGPARSIDKLRRALGRRAATGNEVWQSLADLVNCEFCLGLWFAFPLSLFCEPRNLFDLLVIWLAIAGAQAVLENANTNKTD